MFRSGAAGGGEADIADLGRNKRSALRRIVFDPSGMDMTKVPAAIRRVTASPAPAYVNWPDCQFR